MITVNDSKGLLESTLADLGRLSIQEFSTEITKFGKFATYFKPKRLVFDTGRGESLEAMFNCGASMEEIAKASRRKWRFATSTYWLTHQQIVGAGSPRAMLDMIEDKRREALLELAEIVNHEIPDGLTSDRRGGFVAVLKGDFLRETVHRNCSQPNVFEAYIDLTWRAASWKKPKKLRGPAGAA